MENQLKTNKKSFMKHLIIILCVIAGICSSCNDMLDNIQPYLDAGETIYVSGFTNSFFWQKQDLTERILYVWSDSKEMRHTMAVTR